MFDLEKQVHAALPDSKRPRFEFLLSMRNQLARTSAELCCWGVVDAPTVDRHLVLIQDALTGMISDAALAAALAAEWAVRDATLRHEAGTAAWCAVCRTGGYGLDDLLANMREFVE